MHYPDLLKYFPRDEEWATGDEHLDLKLNQLLLESFNQLSSKSISHFYYLAINYRPRVHNPMFSLNLEMVLKALISLLDSEIEVDQELLKIKGHFDQYQVDNEIVKLDLSDLNLNHHVRVLDQLDFFKRAQPDREVNPFVTHKIARSPYFYEVKPIYKELLDSIEKQALPEKYNHQLFYKLAQKKIVNINGIIKIWIDQRRFYCVH